MSAARILEVLKDGVVVKSQEIHGEVDLGRADGCVIRLEDRAVSRRHAVFKVVGSSVQVEKVSDFGVLSLNGAECTAAVLKDGDVISIGPYLARLATAQTESVPASGPTSGVAADSEKTQPLDPKSNDAFQVPPTGMIEVALGDEDQEASVIESTSGQIVPLSTQTADEAPELGHDAPEMDLASLEATLSPSVSSSGDQGAVDQADFTAPIPDDAPTKVLSASSIVHRLSFDKSGFSKFEEFVVPEGETFIGRDETCGICLDEKKVSRVHAVLIREGLTLKIKDRGSANGTYINGKRSLEAELNPDDEIRIGGTRFRYDPVNPEAERAALEAPAVPVDATSSQLADAASLEVPSLDVESSKPSAEAISPHLALDLAKGAVAASQVHVPVGIEVDPKSAETLGGAGFVPGLTDASTELGKKESLIDKYRALPPPRKILWTGILIGLTYFTLDFVFEEPKAPVVKQSPPAQNQKPGGEEKAPLPQKTVSNEYALLSPEKQAFIKERYGLVESHFKAKDYDKALFELDKIFELVGDYNSARNYQSMALNAKKAQDAQKQEEQRRAELERNKARLDQLLAEVGARMERKEFVQAKELFSKVLEIDPENPQVVAWDKQVREFEAEERAKAERVRLEKEQNEAAWRAVKDAERASEQGDCKLATKRYRAAGRLPGSDAAIQAAIQAGLGQCMARVAADRDPVMAEAKQLEESSEFSRAYRAYQSASQIDPTHRPAFDGMDRIRKLLQDRAKVVYTEAVLAESYSDYALAVKKYKETQEIAPPDDIYFERSKRKLDRLYMQGVVEVEAP